MRIGAMLECKDVHRCPAAGLLALIKMLYQERHNAAAVSTCIAGVAAEGIC